MNFTFATAGRPAIFIDQDGTLIDNIPYNADPEKIRLAKYAGPALRLLRTHGFALFVATNQSGVGRGLLNEAALIPVQEKIAELLDTEDVWLDGIYYCPHWKESKIRQYAIACQCQKPAPGMMQLAAKQNRLILEASWMIGDILDDVEAGNRADCSTILIENGNETEWVRNAMREPDFIVPDLMQAAMAIVSRQAPTT